MDSRCCSLSDSPDESRVISCTSNTLRRTCNPLVIGSNLQSCGTFSARTSDQACLNGQDLRLHVAHLGQQPRPESVAPQSSRCSQLAAPSLHDMSQNDTLADATRPLTDAAPPVAGHHMCTCLYCSRDRDGLCARQEVVVYHSLHSS